MDIINIEVNVTAQSEKARKDAIAMLSKLLKQLREGKDSIDLRTDTSEGHLRLENWS